jgi:hypothetical protein
VQLLPASTIFNLCTLLLLLLTVLWGVHCSSQRLGSASSISSLLHEGCRVVEGAPTPFAGLQVTFNPVGVCATIRTLLCITASQPLLLLLLVLVLVLLLLLVAYRALLLRLTVACSSTVHLHVLLLPPPPVLVSCIHEFCCSTLLLLRLLVLLLLLLPALLLIVRLQLLLSGHTQLRRLQQQQPTRALKPQRIIPLSIKLALILPIGTPLKPLILPGWQLLHLPTFSQLLLLLLLLLLQDPGSLLLLLLGTLLLLLLLLLPALQDHAFECVEFPPLCRQLVKALGCFDQV